MRNKWQQNVTYFHFSFSHRMKFSFEAKNFKLRDISCRIYDDHGLSAKRSRASRTPFKAQIFLKIRWIPKNESQIRISCCFLAFNFREKSVINSHSHALKCFCALALIKWSGTNRESINQWSIAIEEWKTTATVLVISRLNTIFLLFLHNRYWMWLDWTQVAILSVFFFCL